MKTRLTAPERIIEYLRTAIFDGACGLKDVPELIKRVIERDLWRRRILPETGETVVFDDFSEFLRDAPPRGLGADHQVLRRLCAGDVVVLNLLQQTLKLRNRGGDRRSQNFKVNNVTFEKAKKGNSLECSLRRLRQHCPDLHRQVIQGRLSVNRAMIEAGYRRPAVQISRDLSKAAATLKLLFSSEQIEKLITLLRQHD